ncbi:hypothetical protein LSAT2_021154, partial [Lamellibrachia satsuma]
MEKGPKRKHDKKTKSVKYQNLRPRTLHHHHNWQVLHSRLSGRKKKARNSRVIIDALRNRYKQLKSRNDRIVVTKIVASRLLKKYRLRCHAQRELGFHRQSNRFLLEDVTSIKHKRQMRPVNRMKEAITEFYCRDD